MPRPSRRSPGSLLSWSRGSAVACVVLLAPPCNAQLARPSTAPPIVDVRQGDFLLGIGVSLGTEQSFPLSGFQGDLLSAGQLVAAYAMTDRTVLQAEWGGIRLLRIEEEGPSAVQLNDSATDGRTWDAGDVRIVLTWAPLALGEDMALGGWVAVELPNSEQGKGIGSNTTNALIGAVISGRSKRLTLTGRLGLGILESPLRPFSQDDVVAYSLDALITATDRLRLMASIAGRTNPRRSVSLGLEDTGVIRAGAEFRVDRWRLDAGLGHGFAHRSPRWQVDLGLSWVEGGD